MRLQGKVEALERSSTAKPCIVVYKAGKGPDGDIPLSLDKALQEARAGRLKSIQLPLSFNEEQAERCSKKDIAAKIQEFMDGVRRDTEKPSTGNLLICTKPIVFARQAPPRGGVGGYFITEDGTTFHQTEWRAILEKYNAGFIIVRDYDESREPWHERS